MFWPDILDRPDRTWLDMATKIQIVCKVITDFPIGSKGYTDIIRNINILCEVIYRWTE